MFSRAPEACTHAGGKRVQRRAPGKKFRYPTEHPLSTSTKPKIHPPQIIETTSQQAAVIHLAIPRSEMMKQFGPAVQELMAELARQQIKPVSAVFAHHLKMSATHFDFEGGVTVDAPVKPAGRVIPGQLPAAKVARTLYQGPYEGLFAAWGEFDQWLRSNGHQQAEDLWEVYTVGPHSTPDSADWRTELNRPLKT